MKSSTTAGFIAGVVGGIVVMFIDYIYVKIGVWPPYVFPADIAGFLANAIVTLGWNGIWGLIFGFLIAIIFDRIPGKGIVKGLLIGVIYALFSTWYAVYSFWAVGDILWTTVFIYNSTQDKLVYGILFTYLYKKE